MIHKAGVLAQSDSLLTFLYDVKGSSYENDKVRRVTIVPEDKNNKGRRLNRMQVRKIATFWTLHPIYLFDNHIIIHLPFHSIFVWLKLDFIIQKDVFCYLEQKFVEFLKPESIFRTYALVTMAKIPILKKSHRGRIIRNIFLGTL